MRISDHFDTREFERSQVAARAGISIHIPATSSVYRNLLALCEQILEPLRAAINLPIHIDSGYRPLEVNRLVGGVRGSQHTLGQAADIVAPPMVPYDLARKIVDLKLPYDQVIYEFGRWVHVSHVAGGQQRGRALTAYKRQGDPITHYIDGIVPLAEIEGAVT